jgi:hypothetical protein
VFSGLFPWVKKLFCWLRGFVFTIAQKSAEFRWRVLFLVNVVLFVRVAFCKCLIFVTSLSVSLFVNVHIFYVCARVGGAACKGIM